jgi:hypothetical protein
LAKAYPSLEQVQDVIRAMPTGKAAQLRDRFLDATGIGYGVYDRLQQLNCQNVVAVNFGSKPDRIGEYTDANAKYANKRAEMWEGRPSDGEKQT